jgi:predicted  nucleic acid-binding Zn-ribbon protein
LEGQVKTLVELQEIDIYLKEVEKAKQGLPIKMADMDQELEKASAQLKKLEEKLNELQKSLRSLEKDVEAEEDRIKNLAAKSSSVKTNKEYQALLKEVDQAKKVNWEREEALIDLLTKIEESEQELGANKAELKKKEQGINLGKSKLHAQVEELQAGAKERIQGREKITQELDPALIKRYQFIKNRLGMAVAAVKDSACQGCHMKISPQTIVELEKNREIITCPNCYRILHLEKVPV